MGQCSSSGGHGSQTSPNHRLIENLIRKEKKLYTVVLLLLGTGDSGKSTIMKQLKLLNGYPFTTEDRENYVDVMRFNCMTTINSLVIGSVQLGIGLKKSHNMELVQTFLPKTMCYDSTFAKREGMGTALWELWNDEGIQETWSMRSKLALDDNTVYFMTNSRRIFEPDFLPTDQDILHARLRTTGVNEVSFANDDGKEKLKIVDVGGQRSERRKWIHYFNCATAIIYVASLSEYDQRLAEDSKVNRMQESLDLFENLTSLGWFEHCYIILFLNKYDLFLEKIKKSPLSAHWPEYQESDDPEKAIDFIRSRYCALNKSKKMYVHITTATDTRNIEHVFGDVRTSAFSATLDGSY